KRELQPAELREHLRAELPDYMVPAVFIRLDQVPLTANGKVDRLALPAPAAAESSPLKSDLDAPRTDSEQMVADVWRKVLGVSVVGIADNFLDVGGHSLLAMRAVALLEKQTGVHLSPRVFIFQTLEAIAAELERSLPNRSQQQPAATADRGKGKGRLLR